jgi:hypothetical protein
MLCTNYIINLTQNLHTMGGNFTNDLHCDTWNFSLKEFGTKSVSGRTLHAGVGNPENVLTFSKVR